MSTDEKRGSERIIPMVSDEEMVVIEAGDQRYLSKMMDLSESGSLVYLLADADNALVAGAVCRLSLYHHGRVFGVVAHVARANGRLIAFRFKSVDYGTSTDLQTKLIRMEVEWNRLKGLL